MELATRGEYDYPHIDWECKECGEYYSYSGYPPETRCMSGHGLGWKPNENAIEEYVGLLKMLGKNDEIVVCGEGPAPLKGRVVEVSKNSVITESINSPAKIIKWSDNSIEWGNKSQEHIYDDVYHIELL